MDFNAISNTYFHKFKSLIGMKAEYGKRFSEDDPFGFGYEAQYEFMFFNKPLGILDFKKFLESKNVNSVLEIGCSVGLFPRTFPTLFKDIEYTGIDVSKRSIDICKKYLDFEFIHGDYLKMNLNKKFDLIFSFHAIDHVENVNHFLTKSIETCNKFVYITSYRGFFPTLKTHKVEYRADQGIYYNDLSVPEVERVISQNGISKDNFVLHPKSERDKVLYDSELSRIWKYANDDLKKEILKITGLSSKYLDEIPTGLDLSTNIVDKYPGLDKILASKIGFDLAESELQKALVIEIQK